MWPVKGCTCRLEEGGRSEVTCSGEPVPNTIGTSFVDRIEQPCGLEYRQKWYTEAPTLVREEGLSRDIGGYTMDLEHVIN